MTQQLPFFVYGTLLPGQPNDVYWGDGLLRSQPAVIQQMVLYAFPDFPMMVETEEPNSVVIGQLVWVDPDRFSTILAGIDFLEGYNPADSENSLYTRTQRITQTADWLDVNAWVYIGKPILVKGLPIIPHGDWERYTK